jgi:hypothetical protein
VKIKPGLCRCPCIVRRLIFSCTDRTLSKPKLLITVLPCFANWTSAICCYTVFPQSCCSDFELVMSWASRTAFLMHFSIAFIGCSLHSGLLNKLAEITQNLIHSLNVFELVFELVLQQACLQDLED